MLNGINHFEMTACLLEMEHLRYTPAGIPVLSVILQHESTQMEAQTQRQLVFEIPALAIGEIATTLAKLPIGTLCTLRGFMAPKNRKSKNLLFHVTHYDTVTH